jgi:serine/threonine protein kinase
MPDAMLNSRFGPYHIHEKLGTGGVAVVYKAQHQQTGQTVALKVLHATWTDETETAMRFKKEAEIVKTLQHPCIAAVYDYGAVNTRLYLAMQYMARGCLAKRFDKPTAITSQEVVRLLRRVASALDHAHRRGVVHRDIKMENILLDERNDAYLSDFGIARVANSKRVTMTGGIVGTPMYMSPEQARGKSSLDFRADLYSLAVVTYLLTVGRFPFGGTDVLVILNQHVNMLPPAPSEVVPELPHSIDTVLLRGLAKKPEDRYPSADAFIEAYARAMSDYENLETVVDMRSSMGATSQVQHSTPDPWADSKPEATVEELIQAARTAGSREDAITHLKTALELDPWNNEVNRLLHKLEDVKTTRTESVPKPVADLNSPLPAFERKLRTTPTDRRRQSNRIWGRLGCWTLAIISGLFVVFALSIFGVFPPGFVTSVSVMLGGPTPMSEINGTPAKDIPNAVMLVPPAKSAPASTRITDILEPNYTHEYTFDGAVGEHIGVSVQFLSVSARFVRRNVAIVSPSGQNIAESCQREGVTDSSSISYECSLGEAGLWRLLVFGRVDESVGLYFASVQKLGF